MAQNKFVKFEKAGAHRTSGLHSTLIPCVKPNGVMHVFDYMKDPQEMTEEEMVTATRHLLDLQEHKRVPSVKFVQFGRK